MPLKFPRLHIAESVVNRILNIADELDAGPAIAGSGDTSRVAPSVPETVDQSVALDVKLAEPLPGALPGIDQAPDPGATAGGKPLLDTLLEPK